MTDPVPPNAPAAAVSADEAKKRSDKPAFTFTDAGCRSEVRLGALLVLAAVFLWLWLGPQKAGMLYLVGMPLLLVGIPLQAFQARSGRPGFPWKLGLAFTIGAALMWPDLRYRDIEAIDPGTHGSPPMLGSLDISYLWSGLRYREAWNGPMQVQTVVPLLLAAGVWIVAWWPLAARNRRLALKEIA